MAIHFVADLHFDTSVARPAPSNTAYGTFSDGRDPTRRICDVWRARVAPGDTVWILGNVGNPVHLAGLPGEKHLVRGDLDPPMWNCLATRRYASVSDGRVIETPCGTFYLSADPSSAPDGLRVIHGHARSARAGSALPGHVCVSAECVGWGPASLDLILRRAPDLRRAA